MFNLLHIGGELAITTVSATPQVEPQLSTGGSEAWKGL